MKTTSHESRVLDQLQIDEIRMKNINGANRLYRMCVSRKCPPIDRRPKQQTWKVVQAQRKFVSSKRHDKSLTKVWVEKGRDHRWKILENELKELDTNISVATAKHHLTDHEKNFKAVTATIKEMESMDDQIKNVKLEISHLKSQFARVQQKKDELCQKTESEGRSMKFRICSHK